MPKPSYSLDVDAPHNDRVVRQDLDVYLDRLTHLAQSELGSAGQMAFFLGDGLQRAFTDFAFDLLHPRAWTPDVLLRILRTGARRSIHLSTHLSPEHLRRSWEELSNKLEVFALVKNIAQTLGLSSPAASRFIPLQELVSLAYDLPAFQALWAVEGLGHYYAELHYAHSGDPKNLLSDSWTDIPDESLLMLHAGMGLSFADRLLGTLSPDSVSVDDTNRAVIRFLSLCKDNSREGYMGAAIESLGLETRTFYPELIRVVYEQLSKVAPELTGFFWHGAGRALYFSRRYFLPALSTLWSDIGQEITTYADPQSATAGLAWAIVLVNMRQPDVIDGILNTQMGGSASNQAFINGAVSSLIVREATTPGTPLIPHLIRYCPSRNFRNATFWKKAIADPGSTAVHTYYPILSHSHALDQVFQYQDLAGLVSRLSCSAVN